MKIVKRLLSLLLCLLMLLTFWAAVPITASADWEITPGQYMGRAALQTLPNAAGLVFAYDAVAAGVEACQQRIELRDQTHSVTAEEFNVVMTAYMGDYPQHFWLSKEGIELISQQYTTTAVALKPSYTMTGPELAAARTVFEQAADALLEGITPEMSEYQRELLLHDRLAAAVAYEHAPHQHDAYGALVEGKAVCEGYAKALQYLLYRAGILNVMATGVVVDSGTGQPENHAWNLVRIDGDYYHVDVTWDDHGENLFHAYFNMTDEQIREDHIPEEIPYALPACTATRANYFTVNSRHVMGNPYAADQLYTLLDRDGLRTVVYLTGQTEGFFSFLQSNAAQVAARLNIINRFSLGYIAAGREYHVFFNGLRRGDVTLDGRLTAEDLARLEAYVSGAAPLTGDSLTTADMNGDTHVDQRDADLLAEALGLSDQRAAQAVMDAILALPDPVTAQDAVAVAAARAAYDALTDEQKALVTNLHTLQQAEAALTPPAPPQTNPHVTLTVDTVENVGRGDEVTIRIGVAEENTGIGALGVKLTFDSSVLQLVPDPDTGEYFVLGDAATQANATYAGNETALKVALATAQGIQTGGALLTLRFRVVADLSEGQTVPVALDVFTLESISHTALTYTVQAGGVIGGASSAALTMGDVNDDHVINASDALLVLKVSVGKATLDEAHTAIADVNDDHAVDAKDALFILKVAVGKASFEN